MRRFRLRDAEGHLRALDALGRKRDGVRMYIYYSKNFDFVPLPLPLPSRYHFLQALPIIHQSDTIVPHTPSSSLTVPNRSRPFTMV